MPALEAALELVVVAEIRRALVHGTNVDIASLDGTAGRRLRDARVMFVVVGPLLLHGRLGLPRGRAGDVKIARCAVDKLKVGKTAERSWTGC